MRSVPFTAAAAAGCALLLLSGCGSSDDGAGKTAKSAEGPLEAYLKPVTSAFEDLDYEKLQVEQENIIAACMQEAGFEYTPQDSAGSSFAWDEDLEWGTEEFAQKHGYGYAMGPESEDGEEAIPEDPNADYVAAMSESEQAAYWEALWGPQQPESLEEDVEQTWDWTTAGCYGKASNDTYGAANSAYEDPAFVELQGEIGRMYEKVAADPKLTALDAEWSDCMNEAGFDFAKVQDAATSISDAYSALWESADPEAGTDKAAETALREKEISTAVADAKCQTKVGYQEKTREVQFALEQEFVDEHKAELDAWIEQYATDAKATK